MKGVANELAARGHALPDDPGRVAVPEPVVKALLRARGVGVPRGVTAEAIDALPDAAAGLTGPLVLKAYGPGVVHKSDVGAVRVGLAADAASLVAAATEMAAAMAGHGLVPSGFLVEEQAEPGVELIVGAVRGPFGPVATVGLGGTLTEVLDAVVVRLCPLTADAADAMLDAFRGAEVLQGVRGAKPVARDALVKLLLAVAGEEGLVAELGSQLSEFECNPVFATPSGALAVDARLVLHASPPTAGVRPPPLDVEKLFAPRSIAVVGVSTSRPGFGNRAVAAYRAFGWDEGLLVVHPTAAEVDGVRAYRSLADVPGGSVDYALVAVPAASCVELVANARGHAGVVHIISGGFGEVGPDGARLEDELLAAARAAGVRIIGPNCMGVYAPAGRQTFQLGVPREPGSISVVSQSGGLAGDMVKVGERRGLRYAKLVSIGNAIDVTPGELLEHYVDDAATRVIGCYLEGARDGERIVHALRRARGRKPVVVLTGGLSRQGAEAVASHTGSLTGERRVWEAITVATGAAVVETLESFLGALALLDRYAEHPGPGDPDVLVVGVGGGASVLAADACDRAGLRLSPVTRDLVARLRGMGHGAGTSVKNPIEIGIGPAAPVGVVTDVLDAVLPEQPYPDVMVHVNVQSYYGFGTGDVGPLCELLTALGASEYPASRVVFVARNLEVAPGADAEALLDAAVQARLPLYRTLDEAAVAIAAGKEFFRARSA